MSLSCFICNGSRLLEHVFVNSVSGGNGEIDEEGNWRLRKDQKMEDVNPTSLNNAKTNKVPIGVIISKNYDSPSPHQTTDVSR